MTVEVEVQVPTTLLSQFRDAAPNEQERCALLLGSRYQHKKDPSKAKVVIHHIVEVPNIADKPQDEWRISTEDAKDVLEEYKGELVNLQGFLHTHHLTNAGDAELSRSDVDDLPAGMVGLMYHLPSDRVTIYTAEYGYRGRFQL